MLTLNVPPGRQRPTAHPWHSAPAHTSISARKAATTMLAEAALPQGRSLTFLKLMAPIQNSAATSRALIVCV